MTDNELLDNLNNQYASIRPDLNIYFWCTRSRKWEKGKWLDDYEPLMYHAVIERGEDLKLRATSERLEELKQVVDFSLNGIYDSQS